MTYQVLARKWRPRTFKELVGQKPIIQAITHALDQGRLHHAYLLTGTRGVGKTTLARIMAKALNCEKGVSASPCLECQICRDIEAGRFVDLIEIDAASRTKVEDTREILDNVQYRPTVGRYKIYLIDEVHMLSTHSFNALLKTLEEPPEYVVFILATTDLHKIPVTVLSRCLQFTLKHLTPQMITQQLVMVCQDEQITYDETALMFLAKAANGSMRDALSLLDQAIAYSQGCINEEQVSGMLGLVGESHMIALLAALAERDGIKLMGLARQLSDEGADFNYIMDNLVDAFHQIALMQCLPQLKKDNPALSIYTDLFSKEDIQLYYEITLKGREDLLISSSYLVGFEMTLLRLLAFTSPDFEDQASPSTPSAVTTESQLPKPPQIIEKAAASSQPANKVTAPPADPIPVPNNVRVTHSEMKTTPDNWANIVRSLGLEGMGQTVLSHCCLLEKTDTRVSLGIEPAYQAMMTANIKGRIEAALSEYYAQPIKLQVETTTALSQATPAQIKSREDSQRLEETKASLNQDPVLNDIIKQFDGKMIEESIKTKD